MKNLIKIILVMFAFTANAQDLTLLHINAKWNQSNDFELRGLKNVKVQKAFLEEQKQSIKDGIKSVPTIILLDKFGKPRGQWTGGLNFKISATKEEIQQRINVILFESKGFKRAGTE
tara:strand:- start:548 stop:898 length:351 start_codon:yes stop_codon:yes gene_type:complete